MFEFIIGLSIGALITSLIWVAAAQIYEAGYEAGRVDGKFS